MVLIKSLRRLLVFTVLLNESSGLLSGLPDPGTTNIPDIQIKCDEVQVTVTVGWRFFVSRRVPFKSEHLRLGTSSTRQGSCGPREPRTGPDMVISAGLRECGTTSRVQGEWLVYSNELVLLPTVVPLSNGDVIVKGTPSIIPIECHYKRKLTVMGEPIIPTWLPLTSTAGVFGFLQFSLKTVADDCSSPHGPVYQQREPVYLEASVEATQHTPLILYVDHCVASPNADPFSAPSYQFITKHGCLVDSVLPGSLSQFFPREKDNRLCFSVQAFHLKNDTRNQMFISCYLRATLKHRSQSSRDKSCFFHAPTFSWRAVEGDHSLCDCCDAENCNRHSGHSGDTGHRNQLEIGGKLEVQRTLGPLHTLPRSHWPGYLSVS